MTQIHAIPKKINITAIIVSTPKSGITHSYPCTTFSLSFNIKDPISSFKYNVFFHGQRINNDPRIKPVSKEIVASLNFLKTHARMCEKANKPNTHPNPNGINIERFNSEIEDKMSI